MGASYFKAGQVTTDWEKKTMGDSWVIPTTRKHPLLTINLESGTHKLF